MKPLISAIVFLFVLSSLAQDRLNVLFIIVDDLNDMPLHPAGKPHVPTPNFDRLAARGVSFTNAHCNDPICAPSRASMLTGIYPQTSSLYWFEDYRQNAILSKSVTLTEHLASSGYGVYTTGKIYHGNQDPKSFYTAQGGGGNIGPWPWNGKKQSRRGYLPHPQQMYFYADDADPDMDYKWEHTFGPLSMYPTFAADPDKDIPGYRGWLLSGKPFRYASDTDRDAMPDETHAAWAANILSQKPGDKPFALFTGFSRTHTPLYAPQKYFDMFPLDSIEVPKAYLEGDLKDCAPSLANSSLYAFRRYHMLFNHKDRPQLFKEWLQAYMACVAFIDDQVGTVLDALDASPHADNTVVFLTSDHGFHVGGKEALYKQTLWDSGTRIPFIVAGIDGMPKGATCHQPISLIDVYPTFVDLCGLPKDPNTTRSGYALDGHSIKPLLLAPEDGKWTGPDVAITALPGKDHSQHREHMGTLYPHFSVRARDWRYSLTSDGQEELYHYPNDPNEFRNLAANPEFAHIKAELLQQLIALRDGDSWQELAALPSETLEGFEILADVNGAVQFKLGNAVLADIGSKDWAPVRIRVAGKRCQVWLNQRVAFDNIQNANFAAGVLTSSSELRNIRIRKL
ncbi:MAG: arylsulfatase A-like enzyme [Rhodothermales bacterium]|jgi:arylsulfatase A-like enzyme